MSYAKKNSKKKDAKTTETKKGVGTVKSIDKEFKDTVIVSFLKVSKKKSLQDTIDLLAYGDELAAYVANICKSSTQECVESYIMDTNYTLSDGEYISCMTVLNKAVKAVKVSVAARKDTKCTKLLDTINSLMQKADDDTIEMSSVIAQVLGQVIDEVPDISTDDATRVALAVVLNAVVCKTIDICDEDDSIMQKANVIIEEDTAAKTTERKEEKKDDASIEGLIDSVTSIFVQNCMDMWINQYGESRRDEIAAGARQAVSMVVRDTTDLVTVKTNPDKFVQDNTFKVLSLLSNIMKKGAQVAVSELDSDLVRKLLAVVVKDGLGSMNSPIISLVLGVAPSSITEKVLALTVEDRDIADTKKALESKGYTNQDLEDAIEDTKHEIRVNLANKFKDIGFIGLIKKSKDELKSEIVQAITGLVKSRTNTHISLSKKEIDEFADKVIDSILGDAEVLTSGTNTHAQENQEKSESGDGFKFDGDYDYDSTRKECNELITQIFRNARKNAGIID